jgi:perosamine synthetase
MMETSDIVAAVRDVVGPGPVALHEPSVTLDEWTSRIGVSDNSVVGYDAINEFQAKLANVCGVEQALCVSSGTAALHLALMITGVEQFTEVLVPAMTFVATANAVSYCGAIPNFVDVRAHDCGINPFKLGRYLDRICEKRSPGVFNRMTGRRITALIAVDMLGVPCAMDEIKAETGRWGIPVIEDAAQALGSVYKDRPCGSNAAIGIISFNANKIVTTGVGGALLTDDAWVQAKAWELATTARIAHPWRMGDHSCIAWNYRMGNINAALGLPQLERLNELVALKVKVFRAYAKALGFAPVQEDRIYNCWLSNFTLDPLDHRRDEICAALHAAGIASRTLFTPLNELPFYKTCPRDNLEGAQDIWRRTICLPSSPKLGERL